MAPYPGDPSGRLSPHLRTTGSGSDTLRGNFSRDFRRPAPQASCGPLFAEIIAAAISCEQSNCTLMPQCAALGIGRGTAARIPGIPGSRLGGLAVCFGKARGTLPAGLPAMRRTPR
jgi:hypothetical protein